MRMNKRKILQVNKLYYPSTGGIETVVRQLAEGLNGKTKTQVLVCQDRKSKTSVELVKGVRVRRSASRWKISSMPISIQFLADYLRLAAQADIVQLHMPFPLADLACFLAGKHQGKVILWWHSSIVRQKKWMFLYQPFLLFLLNRASKIIVATEGHIKASKLLRNYQEKCVVIPYGLRTEIYQKANDYWKKEKQNINQPAASEELHLLFVGRLVYYKGCEILLDALALTKQMTLTIVGQGPLQEILLKKAKQLKIENRILFLGGLKDSELWKQYQNCDVFILPSVAESEAFGLVQLEAMAFGKPVINTKLPGGVPWVSIHQKTGLSVEPANVTALAEAMNWMKEHPKERLVMGHNARNRVETQFREERMLSQIQELYEQEGNR